MIHEHILNYTRDFINSDYPAKWAAMDLNAKHRYKISQLALGRGSVGMGAYVMVTPWYMNISWTLPEILSTLITQQNGLLWTSMLSIGEISQVAQGVGREYLRGDYYMWLWHHDIWAYSELYQKCYQLWSPHKIGSYGPQCKAQLDEIRQIDTKWVQAQGCKEYSEQKWEYPCLHLGFEQIQKSKKFNVLQTCVQNQLVGLWRTSF